MNTQQYCSLIIFFRNFLLWMALFCIPTQITFSQTTSQKSKKAHILSENAIKNMHNDFFEKSLIQARQALEIAVNLNDVALIASLYNTIGGNFDGLLEYEKALFFYKKGLIYADKANKDELKKLLHNNIGNIYFFDKKEFDKGVYHYNKAIENSLALNDTSQVVFTKINMAWAYFDIGRFDEGFKHLQFANQYFKKHGDPSLLCVQNMLNGMYYSFKNDNQKATLFFDNAIKYGISENERSDLSYAYLEYSKFFNKNGAYKKAYSNLSKFNSLNEELNAEEKIKKANLAGINLEIDEYKREIDNISSAYKSKEIIWKEEHENHQKTVIIILLLSIVTVLVFFGYSRYEKLKQLHKYRAIEIVNQQNMINATIDGQEMERKKIAAFLHDNISALLSSAGMHLNVFSTQNNNSPQEIIKTKNILEEAHKKVRDLSHELIPALLVRFGLVYAIEDLCEKISNSKITIQFEQKSDSSFRLEETLELKIYFILSELINNIIKHSEASWAKISIRLENSQVHIEVKDNGKGFNLQDHLINEGYGINRIKARITNINGTIDIQSAPQEGTTIRLCIPVV